MARWARRVDGIHAAAIKLLKAHRFSVTATHGVAGGFPDLCVGKYGKNCLLELKDGSLPLSRRKLTPDELKWRNGWLGQVETVESPEEALRVAEAECCCTLADEVLG